VSSLAFTQKYTKKNIETMDWDNHKANVLSKEDKSAKGSIDAPIRDLVSAINESPDFLTTSSCSGRIMLINETSKTKRKNKSEFLYVSHDYVRAFDNSKLCDCFYRASGNVFLKLEPLIVHVQCRTLNNATWLLHLMKTRDQFKHSCIVSASNDKWIVSIKGMVKLEIPLIFDDEKIIDDELLAKYIKIANTRMIENFSAIDALTRFVQEGHLACPQISPAQTIDFRTMHPVAVLSSEPLPVNPTWTPSLVTISDRDFTLDLSGRFITDLTNQKRIGIGHSPDGSKPSLLDSTVIRPLKDCLLVTGRDTLWALCWWFRKPKLIEFMWHRVHADTSDIFSVEELQWVAAEIPVIPHFDKSYERYGKILVVYDKENVSEETWRALCHSKECTSVLYRPHPDQQLEVLFTLGGDHIAQFKDNGVQYRIDFSLFSFTPSAMRQRLLDQVEQDETIVEITDSPNCVGIHLLAKSNRLAKLIFVIPDDSEQVATAIHECLELNNVDGAKYTFMTLSTTPKIEWSSISRVIVTARSIDCSQLTTCVKIVHMIRGMRTDSIRKL